MELFIEPPMSQWRVEPKPGGGPGRVATGHQLAWWHPGILAKGVAAAAAAADGGGGDVPIHLFVDHDTNAALQLTLPVVREDAAGGEDRLEAVTVSLGDEDLSLSVWARAALPVEALLEGFDRAGEGVGGRVAADLSWLRDAMVLTSDGHRSLAGWMAELTLLLMEPVIGPMDAMFSSELLDGDADGVLAAMREDAEGCVGCYNRAVAAHPEAGVPPLTVDPMRVELPVWRLEGEPGGGGRKGGGGGGGGGGGAGRLRVYADLSDSRPMLVDERDRELDPAGAGVVWHAAPRAVLLSAVMRRWRCGLFIHGRGGAVYDRVTDAWWRAWRGEALPAAAMVTADVRLPLEVPVASRQERDRAVWYRHHLPHNVDRHAHLTPIGRAKASAKAALLEQLRDEPGKRRKAAAFQGLHRINADLAKLHPELVAQARAAVARAEAGVRNAGVAARRDWPFVLYPADRIAALQAAIDDAV